MRAVLVTRVVAVGGVASRRACTPRHARARARDQQVPCSSSAAVVAALAPPRRPGGWGTAAAPPPPRRKVGHRLSKTSTGRTQAQAVPPVAGACIAQDTRRPSQIDNSSAKRYEYYNAERRTGVTDRRVGSAAASGGGAWGCGAATGGRGGNAPGAPCWQRPGAPPCRLGCTSRRTRWRLTSWGRCTW